MMVRVILFSMPGVSKELLIGTPSTTLYSTPRYEVNVSVLSSESLLPR